jgi:hypothetical protein
MRGLGLPLTNPQERCAPLTTFLPPASNIFHAPGQANGHGRPEWNVPLDTVITITVSPKAIRLVRELNLDLARFARSEVAHPHGLVRYASLEQGISLESKLSAECEVLMSVTYSPRQGISICDVTREPIADRTKPCGRHSPSGISKL